MFLPNKIARGIGNFELAIIAHESKGDSEPMRSQKNSPQGEGRAQSGVDHGVDTGAITSHAPSARAIVIK